MRASTRFEDVVRDVDVVFDTVGGDTQERSWKVLKPGGILVSILQAPSEEKAAAHGVRQQLAGGAGPAGPVLREIAALVDAGKIKPIVGGVHPLQDAAKVHDLVMAVTRAASRSCKWCAGNDGRARSHVSAPAARSRWARVTV